MYICYIKVKVKKSCKSSIDTQKTFSKIKSFMILKK